MPWIRAALFLSPSLPHLHTQRDGDTHTHTPTPKVGRISDTGSRSGERTVLQPEGCTLLTPVHSLATKSSLQPHGPCPVGAWQGGGAHLTYLRAGPAATSLGTTRPSWNRYLLYKSVSVAPTLNPGGLDKCGCGTRAYHSPFPLALMIDSGSIYEELHGAGSFF